MLMRNAKSTILHKGIEKTRCKVCGKKVAALLCMAVSLSFTPVNTIRAAEVSDIQTVCDDTLRERVYAEVLSGEITDQEDVLRVALAQYEERENGRARMSGTDEVDDNLTITQVLDSHVNEKGHIIENIVTTDLLVLDRESKLARANSIKTGYGNLSEYSIYATMNVSVTYDSTAGTVRFDWFDTKLTYGTAMTAGSLTQSSTISDRFFQEDDPVVNTYAYPSAGKNYHYVPSNKNMVNYMSFTSGRTCKSVINAGSRTFILAYSFLFETCNQNQGTWETQYN